MWRETLSRTCFISVHLCQAVAPVLRAPNKRPRTEGRRVRFDDNEELTVPKSEAPAVDSGSATLTKVQSEHP